MRSLRLSGAQKVAAGQTTIEEVLRVTPQSEQK
jgi:general secretion pathway protein E